jgi:hypothetical protein
VKGKKERRGRGKQRVALITEEKEMNKMNAKSDSKCKEKHIKTMLTINVTLRNR